MRRDVTTELKELRLLGMVNAWTDLTAQGDSQVAASKWLIEHLLQAEHTDRAMRSISHQMKVARFPIHRDLAGFDFTLESAKDLDEGQIDKLAALEFAETAQNVVFIGGPGTSKTHLATAIGVAGITLRGLRVRFYCTVDLVNALEQEKTQGKAGRIAQSLLRMDLVILDELGYLPFSQAGGALLFHLLSKLCEHTSVAITTNLSFSEWTSVFGDAKMTTDLASRGIDIAMLPVVVNYDLPRSATDYTHRIGRTGRAGAHGDAVSFVTAAALAHWQLIQKRESLELALEQIPGFEPTETPPPPSPGNGGIKGSRPSKKDKLRAAQAQASGPD